MSAKMSVTQKSKMRVVLKAYDPAVLDEATQTIIDTGKRSGAKIAGPIPMPTKREVYTVLKSPHKHKKSREQFEIRTHKRVLEIEDPNSQTVDSLKALSLPAGVDIAIKVVA